MTELEPSPRRGVGASMRRRDLLALLLGLCAELGLDGERDWFDARLRALGVGDP